MKFIDILIEKQIINGRDKEIYDYGLFVLLFNLLSLSIVLIIGKIFNQLLISILFLLFYSPVRMFLGGYHCKHPLTCICSFSISYILILITYLNINILNYKNEIMICLLICLIHKWFYSKEKRQCYYLFGILAIEIGVMSYALLVYGSIILVSLSFNIFLYALKEINHNF